MRLSCLVESPDYEGVELAPDLADRERSRAEEIYKSRELKTDSSARGFIRSSNIREYFLVVLYVGSGCEKYLVERGPGVPFLKIYKGVESYLRAGQVELVRAWLGKLGVPRV